MWSNFMVSRIIQNYVEMWLREVNDLNRVYDIKFVKFIN